LSATVLILPGIGNSGPLRWQSIWAQSHPEFVRVQQPDWDNPVCEEWVAVVEEVVKRAGPSLPCRANAKRVSPNATPSRPRRSAKPAAMLEVALAVLVGAARSLHDAIEGQESAHHSFLMFLPPFFRAPNALLQPPSAARSDEGAVRRRARDSAGPSIAVHQAPSTSQSVKSHRKVFRALRPMGLTLVF
jgi:Serine hydrolase